MKLILTYSLNPKVPLYPILIHLVLGGDAPDPGLAHADVLEPPGDGLPLAAEHVGPPAQHTAASPPTINTILGPGSPPHRVLAVHRPHHASRPHTAGTEWI